MCFIATSNLFTRPLVLMLLCLPHKQLVNLSTRQLPNSPTRPHVTMSSSQATCLLVNLSTRLLLNLTHLILAVNSLHTIAHSR